jgi:hypothetical protein
VIDPFTENSAGTRGGYVVSTEATGADNEGGAIAVTVNGQSGDVAGQRRRQSLLRCCLNTVDFRMTVHETSRLVAVFCRVVRITKFYAIAFVVLCGVFLVDVEIAAIDLCNVF